MYIIAQIMSLICLCGAILDNKIESPDGYSRSKAQLSMVSVNASSAELTKGGNTYEKPTGGKCYVKGSDILGCSCSTDQAVAITSGGTVVAVVCTQSCGSGCPKPPRGAAECLFGVCFIRCKYDEDCPGSGFCEDFRLAGFSGFGCMFAQ
ncbi:hypothetical protein FOZ60_008781 [Perkinsus olseni]|uniref:Immunoglobulin super DCC subclass member n=1 Tax=Perkinsus olseni TaxID=32597 RepID=A0A7J6NIN9_PEROL|nr:hypothetical protein FOZ60_008781 [Perkinsus olseni]